MGASGPMVAIKTMAVRVEVCDVIKTIEITRRMRAMKAVGSRRLIMSSIRGVGAWGRSMERHGCRNGSI